MKDLDKHLRLFDLTAKAKIEDVKKAYRRLVREWHPDRHFDDEGLRRVAEERIKEINVAYNTLEDWCARRQAGAGEEDKENDLSRESIEWTIIDKETIGVNLPLELVFPIVYDAFRELGLRDILWSTIDLAFHGLHLESQARSHSKLISVMLQERGRQVRLQYSFQFSHHLDNIKVGFVEGPEILPALRHQTGGDPSGVAASRCHRQAGRDRLSVDRRHKLKTSFFSQFQLHEATWSEIRKKKVLCGQGEDWLELQGLSINQVLNLYHRALTKVGATKIRWNTQSGVIQGTTGWSLRSCGQLMEAQVKGSACQFRVQLASVPLAYGGQTSQLKDLGRGKDEVRIVMGKLLEMVT